MADILAPYTLPTIRDHIQRAENLLDVDTEYCTERAYAYIALARAKMAYRECQ